jgi:TRAP-type C4-dicarboxylate transport system permease small subunit
MKGLSAINDFIIKHVKRIAIVFFIVMIIASAAQILFRFLLNLPLDWTEEISRFLFVWSTMLGISIYTKSRAHSTVDVLMMMLKEQHKRYLLLLIDVLSLIFIVVIIAGGFKMTSITMNQLSPSCGIPMGLMYLSVPVSGIIMLLINIEHILKDIVGGEA